MKPGELKSGLIFLVYLIAKCFFKYYFFFVFVFQTCRSIFVWRRNPFHPKKNSTLTNRSRKSISSQTVPFFLLSKSFSSLFLFHDLTIASIERGNFIYFFWFFVTLYTSQSMFEWSKILCFFHESWCRITCLDIFAYICLKKYVFYF